MAEKSKFWYLKNINIFDGMDDGQMGLIEKMSTMNRVNKHLPIYFPEQPSNNIYFLKEGHVKLSRMNVDGREIILDVLGPGEIFGELSLIEDGGQKEMAEALDEILICTINKRDFENTLMNNPALILRLTKWVGFRLRRFEEKMSDLAFKDVNKRIISFLLRYAEEFGKIKSGKVTIPSFLSHQEIAYLTATSRQTVTTVLNDLRTKNIISFDRKSLQILNPNQLQNLSR